MSRSVKATTVTLLLVVISGCSQEMPVAEGMPVADPCEGVMCNTGEQCAEGECVATDPCEQVMCSEAEQCVNGVCIVSDLCDGRRRCGDGEQCVNGVCVASDLCGGRRSIPCDDGEQCVNGVCVASHPCEQVMCNTGEECVNGECLTLDLCDTVGISRIGVRLYLGNNCASCHGTDAAGGTGPTLIGVGCELIFLNLSGNDPHPLTVEGVTRQDAADLEAYLNSL